MLLRQSCPEAGRGHQLSGNVRCPEAGQGQLAPKGAKRLRKGQCRVVSHHLDSAARGPHQNPGHLAPVAPSTSTGGQPNSLRPNGDRRAADLATGSTANLDTKFVAKFTAKFVASTDATCGHQKARQGAGHERSREGRMDACRLRIGFPRLAGGRLP